LLFLSTVINYIDRQTLSILGLSQTRTKITTSDPAIAVAGVKVRVLIDGKVVAPGEPHGQIAGTNDGWVYYDKRFQQLSSNLFNVVSECGTELAPEECFIELILSIFFEFSSSRRQQTACARTSGAILLRNHFVMRGLRVVAREVFPALLRNHCALVVCPRDGPYVIKRVPKDDGDELDLAALWAPQEITPAESRDSAQARQ
jgi:hypothetical protein